MTTKLLILASASARRAELLCAAGIEFEVIVSPAEEPEEKPAGIPTALWPMCLAYMKAAAVRGKLKGKRKLGIRNSEGGAKERTILAADTIVVAGGGGSGARERILNKAADRAQARRMLSLLNEKVHRVITGCCLMRGGRVRLFSAEAVCRLKFTRRELEAYLDSGLWRGKAGAYGIQDRADPFVELLSGEHATVVGLPIGLVQLELAGFGEE